MKNLTLINKKIWEENKKYFENIEFYAKKIKEEAIKLLGEDTKVLIFGSVAKGNYLPGSDIDVLIISRALSPNWIENRSIRTKLKSSIDPFSPFQLHLVRPDEFKDWYKKFIKDEYIEI